MQSPYPRNTSPSVPLLEGAKWHPTTSHLAINFNCLYKGGALVTGVRWGFCPKLGFKTEV
jgi:hypothetical protein